MKTKYFSIIMIIILIMSLSTFVFAYYLYERKLNDEVEVGQINNVNLLYKYTNDGGETYTNIDSTLTGYNSTSKVITCYGSEKRESDVENYIQLNQLAVDVELETEIAVRIRIKVQDVWESQKTYTSGVVKTSTIIRDWDDTGTNPVLPFTFASGWTYDVNTGYAYYENILTPSSANSNGVISLNFMIPNEYYYLFSSSFVGYRETIIVLMNFQVDVVQANRASVIWGV